MKKILLLLFMLVVNNLLAQDLFIFAKISSGNYEILQLNPDNCSATTAQRFTTSFTDIALHPNGNMYGCTTSGNIYELNMNNGNTTKITDPGSVGFITGMTIGADGTFYLAEQNIGSLYTYQLGGSFTYKGDIGYSSSGDLTFRNGQLYLGSVEYIIKVDIDDPPSSSPATDGTWFNPSSGIWGIMTDFVDCSTQYTYGLTGGTSSSDLYRIDLENQTSSLLCTLPLQIYGATSSDEYRASSSINVTASTTDATCLLQGSIELNVISGENLEFIIKKANTDNIVSTTTSTSIQLGEGIYDVLIKDDYNCEVLLEDLEIEAGEVSITAEGVSATCTSKGKIKLGATSGGNVEYTIKNIETGSEQVTTNSTVEVEAGTYEVIGKEGSCESEIKTVIVESESDEIKVTIVASNGRCDSKGRIQFTNPQGDYNYTISAIGEVTDSSVELEDGTYIVTITDDCGSRPMIETVIITTICDEDNSVITVPSAFAPNGNSVNETFKVLTTKPLLIVDYRIYNRWGQLMYEADNFTSSQVEMYWNGTHQGEMHYGEFAYYIEYQILSDQSTTILEGVSLVIR